MAVGGSVFKEPYYNSRVGATPRRLDRLCKLVRPGFVGIGTTSPQSLLQVAGNATVGGLTNTGNSTIVGTVNVGGKLGFTNGVYSAGAGTLVPLSVNPSPWAYQNINGVSGFVYLSGGTVSSIAIDGTTVANTVPATVYLAPGHTVTVTYSSQPVAVWQPF